MKFLIFLIVYISIQVSFEPLSFIFKNRPHIKNKPKWQFRFNVKKTKTPPMLPEPKELELPLRPDEINSNIEDPPIEQDSDLDLLVKEESELEKIEKDPHYFPHFVGELFRDNKRILKMMHPYIYESLKEALYNSLNYYIIKFPGSHLNFNILWLRKHITNGINSLVYDIEVEMRNRKKILSQKESIKLIEIDGFLWDITTFLSSTIVIGCEIWSKKMTTSHMIEALNNDFMYILNIKNALKDYEKYRDVSHVVNKFSADKSNELSSKTSIVAPLRITTDKPKISNDILSEVSTETFASEDQQNDLQLEYISERSNDIIFPVNLTTNQYGILDSLHILVRRAYLDKLKLLKLNFIEYDIALCILLMSVSQERILLPMKSQIILTLDELLEARKFSKPCMCLNTITLKQIKDLISYAGYKNIKLYLINEKCMLTSSARHFLIS